MDAVANARLYWQIVEACLVEIYHWEPAAAHAKVLRVRGRMTERAIVQDVTYHLQPFNVASDLAKIVEPVSDSVWSTYEALVARVTAMRAGETVPDNPRGNASTKARAVAALSR